MRSRRAQAHGGAACDTEKELVMPIGWAELLIILVIVIAIFGAGRLAGIGNALGGSIREFKKAVKEDDVPAVKGETKPEGESKA